MTHYKIVSGPSKFDLMLGIFNRQSLVFKTKEGIDFEVRVKEVRTLNDDGHDAWRIRGLIKEENGGYKNCRRCSLLFSGKDRTGSLDDLGPKNERFTIEFLNRLSDDGLRREIASSQKSALMWKEDLDAYLATLNPHDRLVVEARASQLMVEVALHPRMEHKLFVEMGKREGAVSQQLPVRA